MTRVDLPGEGTPPATEFINEGGYVAFEYFQQHSEPALQLVHAAIENYVNDDSLTGDDDYFPRRSELSREYYTYETAYAQYVVEGVTFNVANYRCCCTAAPGTSAEKPNYLGLDVSVEFRSDRGQMSVTGVDSSAM
jgi:hypothetical protein